MKSPMFLVLISAGSFLGFHALPCERLPVEYLCFNNVSATICEVLESCNIFWKAKQAEQLEWTQGTDELEVPVPTPDDRQSNPLANNGGEDAYSKFCDDRASNRTVYRMRLPHHHPVNPISTRHFNEEVDEEIDESVDIVVDGEGSGDVDAEIDEKLDVEVDVVVDIFNTSVIILTSTTGLLMPTEHTDKAEVARNSIHVYYHCPDCQPGDDLILFENQSASFHHAILSCSGYLNMGFLPTIYKLVPVDRSIYSMVFPFFHAEIRRGGQLVQSALPMETHNWMEQLQPSLQNLTISELVIPGTHQSATYLRPYSDVPFKVLTSRWFLCQNSTILQQLYNGIRYFDIRVACLNVDGRCQGYYAHHGGIETIPFQVIVQDINYFMRRTQEIVVLAFKQFSIGFKTDNDHNEFITYLWHEFRWNLFPMPEQRWKTPLSRLWYRGRRLIVSYDHPRGEDHALWPLIQQRWCNKRNVEELHTCLSNMHRSQPNMGNSAPVVDMVQLTHDWKSLVADAMPWTQDNSVRSWAQRLSPYILKWYYEEWYASANIIAVDFFEFTGVVELAIHLNKRRASERASVVRRNI